MSTRGFISFVVDGVTKTAYNHHDSYPEYLGVNVLDWTREVDLKAAATAVGKLRVVTDEDRPTDADIDLLAPFYSPNVGGPSERPSWYQLLRGTQGDPAAMFAAGVIEDGSEFPGDSLFAEWGYVVDFDTHVFEVYVGFQTEPHNEGRFAHLPRRDGYYPVRLAASWPLDSLPDVSTFADAAEKADTGLDGDSDV